MIGRAFALGLALLLLLAAPSAFAEEASTEPVDWARRGVYLEMDAQLTIEDFRAPTNRPPQPSNTSGSFSMRAGWRPTLSLAFEVQYERLFDLYDKNDANLITINAKLFVFKGKRYQPFIRTGFGAIWGDLPNEWTRKGTPDEALKTVNSFVWKIGAGFDYPLTESLSMSLFGDYVIPTEEFHRLNYAIVGFGLRHMF